MTTPTSADADNLKVAFLPVHKLAFGIATGCAAALLVALLTIDAMVRPATERLPVELLSVYFSGYSVSWPGVLIGAGWAGFSGFVFGWFLAFARNVVLATQLVILRTRANLAQTRGFLDHI